MKDKDEKRTKVERSLRRVDTRVRRLPDPHENINWGKGRMSRIVFECQKDPKNRDILRKCIADGKSRVVIINGRRWRIHGTANA